MMNIDVENCQSLLCKTKSHQYFLPHPVLRNSIAHYTLMDESFIDQTSLILVPDLAGCIVIQQIDDVFECLFWGATTKSVEVGVNPQQAQFCFFIEFLPTGAYSLFHTSQHQYLDERIELSTMHPTLSQHIKASYLESDCFSSFLHAIDQLMLSFLIQDTSCMQFMQRRLKQHDSIEDVVEQVGYSRRQVQRMFQEQLGTSMKATQRIERINHAIQLMKDSTNTLTQIAYLCGYFDQAHFQHEFKQVCGSTPRQYRQNMSIFYNEELKF